MPLPWTRGLRGRALKDSLERARGNLGAHGAALAGLRPRPRRDHDPQFASSRVSTPGRKRSWVALVPAFIGEAHFNARSYSLAMRTPERRELDYVRQNVASVDMRRGKIVGLCRSSSSVSAALHGVLPGEPKLSVQRAGWGES